MNRKRPVFLIASLSAVLCFWTAAYSSPQVSLDDILDKNFQAVGGKDKIASIQNFSFRDGETAYYLSSSGQMKMASGKEPVITEVILVGQKSVVRNCFNKLSDFAPLLEQTFQTRARLYAGLFTLLNFRGELELLGTRRFGPKEFYMLRTQTKDLEVEFFIDSKDSLLKRVVFLGHNPDFGKYEVNHDIGPYQEIDGINIPSSWFASQVGTRGITAELADVKWNLALPGDFFTDYGINIGEADYSDGVLKGNIVDFQTGRGDQLMISTNWTDECFQRAGFAPGEKLVLTLGESKLEVDFYTSQPPRSAYANDAILMVPARSNENYVIYVLASAYRDLAEKIEPLMPIQIKKKD
jgi:hypothetical protein